MAVIKSEALGGKYIMASQDPHEPVEQRATMTKFLRKPFPSELLE